MHQQVVNAKTKESFEQAWETLRNQYSDQQDLLNYVQNNKYPKRHEWAKAFTCRYCHFDHQVTSKGEGGYAHFKQYL